MSITSFRKSLRPKQSMVLLTSVLALFFFAISFVPVAKAATQWVSDPGTCNVSDPTNFPGQNCTPQNICGDNAGLARCYLTSSLLPPAVSATSNTLHSASYPNGGYIVNCYATQDSAAPYCDNNTAYWCNRSNTCYTTQQRDTTCTANTWGTATCGSCRSGYGDCNGDAGVCEIQYGVTNYPTGANNNYLNCTTAQCDTGYLDCDAGGIDVGNGCEIQNGATCTLGGLTGTWNGCTCLVGKQYFETGTEAQYATTDPLLWGVQFGAGPLIQFGNSGAYDLFVVNNDGSVWLNEIIAPVDPTNSLYNVGGDLYWNGAMVGSGGGSGGGWVDDGTVVRLETATDYVGIGTNSPKAKLDIGESMIGVPSGDMSVLLTQDGGETFFETASTDMAEGLIMHGGNAGQAYDYGIVRSIASPPGSYGSNMERGLHIFTGDNDGMDPDNIMFSIEGNEIMRITDQGRVAIGTNSPIGARLQVNSNSIINTYFEINDNSRGGLYVGNGAMFSIDEAGLYDAGGDYPLAVFDATNNRMRYGQSIAIDVNTSYVGIGTPTPSTTLDVYSGGNGEIANFSNSDVPNGYSFGFDMYGGETGLYEMTNGALLVGTKAGDYNTVMLGQDVMYINQSTQNVGIGTDTPNFPLQVRSASGINTYFQVDDSSRGGVYIGNGGMYSGDEAGLYDVGGDFPLAVYDASNDTVKLGHYITVDVNSGYVGMWESSPSAQLEITDNGNTTFEPLLLLSHGGAGQSVGFVPVGADPNGVVTSPRGSLAMDYANGNLYINKDSLTDWELLSGGAGGSQTLQDVADYTIANEGYVLANFGSSTFEDDGGATKWEANAGGYQMALAMNGGTSLTFISDNGVNNSGQVIFNDGRLAADRRGIEYAADYSATFTDRSLVDKGYVDSMVGGGTLQTVTDNGNTTTNDIDINDPTGSAMLNVISGTDDAYLNLVGNAGATSFQMSADGGTDFSRIETASDGSFAMQAGSKSIFLADATTGNVGVGWYSSPARRLHVVVDDTNTSSMTYAERLTHTSTGMPIAGFGTGIEFELENRVHVNKISGTIDSVWANANSGVEDATIIFKSMLNGVLTEAMRIDDAGNLAVGTPYSTGYKLYVAGSGRFQVGEDTNAFVVYNEPNANMQIRVDGDNNNVILSEHSGYVGIGATAPTELLHMESDAAAASMLLTDAISQDGIQIGYASSGGSYLEGDYFGNDRTFTIKSNSGYKWGFFGVDGMAGIGQSADDLGYAINVDDAGKVGIGTNAPNRLLHTETLDAVTNAVTYNSRLTHFSSGVATAGFGTGMEFELENNINVSKIAGAIESKWFSAVTAEEFSDMSFKTMVDGVLTDSLYIGENGNVGIGTSSVGDRLVINNSTQNPSSFLRINGEDGSMKIGYEEEWGVFEYDATGTGRDLSFYSDGNEVMILDADGSVLIGAGMDPVGPMLTIMGDNTVADAPVLQFRTIDPNVQSQIYFKPGDEKTYWDLNSAGGDGGLVITSGSEELMRFYNDEIAVNYGGLGSKRFRVAADTNANAFYVSGIGTGSVGIGTDSPDRAFHVEIADAVTNAVTYAGRLSHTSTGTVNSLFGTGLEFELENNSNVNKVAAVIESTWGSPLNGVEDGDLALKTLVNGTMTEALRLTEYGIVVNKDNSAAIDFRVASDTADNALRVNATGDGAVGIGIDIPLAKLHVSSGALAVDKYLRFDDNGKNNVDHLLSSDNLNDPTYLTWDFNELNAGGGGLVFVNNDEPILKIDSTGVTIGTYYQTASLKVYTNDTTVATFDRTDGDGVLVSLGRDGVQQGSISVSSGTVSYNAFTGSHYTWHDGAIEKGTLVSMTGQNKRLNDDVKSEVLYGVEVTKQINSPKVLGSYLSVLEPGQALSNANPALVMAVGNGEVWVADKGANIEAGDYLISSDVAGHAQKMNSDFALNYVVARAAEDIDWSTVTETSVDGAKHKMITVFFDSLVVNTQMVDVIKSNQMLGSQLNLTKMNVADANKVKKQLGGEMKVGSSTASSAMQVGQATISSKRSSVDVTFDQSYDNAPIVMLTLASDSSLMRYFVSNVTATGFRLNLYPTQYQDTLFNWQAYPSSNVQTSNSEEEDILEDLPEYQVEQDLIVIPPVEEEPVIDEEPTIIEEAAATGLEILVEGDASPVAEETVVEEESLNLDGAEDVLYNESLSIVEVGDELGEQISETPAEPEAPAEVPVSPEISETPAEILE